MKNVFTLVQMDTFFKIDYFLTDLAIPFLQLVHTAWINHLIQKFLRRLRMLFLFLFIDLLNTLRFFLLVF